MRGMLNLMLIALCLLAVFGCQSKSNPLEPKLEDQNINRSGTEFADAEIIFEGTTKPRIPRVFFLLPRVRTIKFMQNARDQG